MKQRAIEYVIDFCGAMETLSFCDRRTVMLDVSLFLLLVVM